MKRGSSGRKRATESASGASMAESSASGRAESAEDPASAFGSRSLDPMSIATGLFAGTVVYVAYYPSDSVSVEKGDALWLALLAIIIATISWAGRPLVRSGVDRSGSGRAAWLRSGSSVLGIVPWILAAWMMLAAWATSPPGNLRMATNEGWFWVTAAALFTSVRILAESVSARRALTTLAVVCAFGMAVHGLHQYFVSLPANRAEYRRNPERILELAGVDAPAGSAERIIFENRLFDGGPTGTFALANSLAAALLVGVIAGVGRLRFGWKSLGLADRCSWSVLVLTCGACLMAARSRSATLAMLIAVLLSLVAASMRGSNKRALWIGVATTAVLATGVVLFLATMGNREWFEEAPASLAFRFQYWRSSWNLVLEHPWFGAGPGNFQSLYERYREASAHEQIAEPHNLFVETLAGGGFVAFALLVLMFVAAVAFVANRLDHSVDDEESKVSDDRQRWVWLGAILSLAMVWLIGMASRHPPDLQASPFVVPLSIIGGLVLWPTMRRMSSRELDLIWVVMVIAIGIHLMAAGGWTVPGVAIALWLGVGLLTRCGAQNAQGAKHGEQVPLMVGGLVIAIGVVLAGLLYFVSLRPVQQQRQLMASVLRTGQWERRRELLLQAVAADPWSPDAALWLADSYRWALVSAADASDPPPTGEPWSEQIRQQWSKWLETAKQRAGNDPAIYRMIGAQQLHVYQRHGNPLDLEAAAETIQRAVDWSPANQWMMAQMAVIAEARGDRRLAEELSRLAWELSEHGENIERSLMRQQVFVVRRIGPPAETGPVRVPAAELLQRPAPEPDDSGSGVPPATD